MVLRLRCLLAKVWHPIKLLLRWELVNLSLRWHPPFYGLIAKVSLGLKLFFSCFSCFLVSLSCLRMLLYIRIIYLVLNLAYQWASFCLYVPVFIWCSTTTEFFHRSGYFCDPSLGVWQLPRINEYSWIFQIFFQAIKFPFIPIHFVLWLCLGSTNFSKGI